MVAYPVTVLPNTAHSVFYSYAITAGVGGKCIGSFEKFGSSFSRTHERIREILWNRGPITKEIIWGGTDIKVTLTKVELYKQAMLQALGFEIYTIEQLNQTIDIIEIMTIPADPGEGHAAMTPSAPSSARYIIYKDCVPTSVSKDVDTGTAKIVESMELECRTVEYQDGSPPTP